MYGCLRIIRIFFVVRVGERHCRFYNWAYDVVLEAGDLENNLPALQCGDEAAELSIVFTSIGKECEETESGARLG